MSSRVELVRRPEARTDSVEDLVAMTLRGEVRIPVFQRGLEWQSNHVLDLFDSIYRGFPIGSLLLRRAPSIAGPVRLGPMTIFGIETRSALWVVDGQQRLTSLAVGLGHPGDLPTASVDPFVVYFDPAAQQFHAPPRDGEIPSMWVPLPRLLNGGQLTEWVYAWPHGKDDDLRRVVFEAGKRLREYRIPLYVIDTDDEDAVRTIFHRINTAGKPLSWSTVHDALFGHRGKIPSTLADLADQLEEVGMGRLDEESQLGPCLLALRGLDVTRNLDEHHRRDPAVLENATGEALPVLREVLSFLRVHAEVPHLRLLPFSTPLIVLTRFFQLHSEPNERTLTLLVRWVWRSFLDTAQDERTLKRRGVAVISDDEEASAQHLLALVTEASPFVHRTPASFDARSAQSRIALLGMASLGPQNFTGKNMSGGDVDIAALIREVDRDAFRPLLPLKGGATSSAANRLLLPGRGAAIDQVRAFIEEHGVDHAILRSHAISPQIASELRDGNYPNAIELRTDAIDEAISILDDRHAAWHRTDRPSLEYLLAQAAGE